MVKDRIAEVAKHKKDLIDKQREQAIRAKELQALQARSKGLDKQAKQLEKQVELMKTAVEFSNRYNMSLKAAFQLASKLDQNKNNSPTNNIKEIDRDATGGISSMAAIGGGGLTGALKPIEKANELAEKQLVVLGAIEQNTQQQNSPSFS
jgi:hypothetical protein